LQFPIIIDLTVVDESVPSLLIPERLIAARGKVHERKSSVDQPDPFVREDPIVVGPSMLH
jgi:hypothetical protein